MLLMIYAAIRFRTSLARLNGTTGAPTLRDIDRAEGRDVQEAVSVSGQVTDADLAPPPEAG